MKKIVSYIIISLFTCSVVADSISGSVMDIYPWGNLGPKGNIAGIHPTLLNAISEDTNIHISNDLVPLPRLINDLKSGKSAYGILIPREDMNHFLVDVGKVQDISQYILFNRLSSDLDDHNIPHVNNLVYVRGEVFHPDEAYAQHGVNLTEVNKIEVNNFNQVFKLLLSGKAEAAIYTAGALKSFLKEHSIMRYEFGEEKRVYKGEVHFFLSSRSEQYSDRLKNIFINSIKKLSANKTIESINSAHTN